MKIKKIIFFIPLVALFFCATPNHANAAKIFIDLPEKPISVGNVSLLKVMIDTEGKEINAVEGVLKFTSTVDITSINTGGSIFDLWTRKPSVEADTISFTGGTTAGVYGKSLKLFTIAIKPSSTKTIEISLEKATTYLNDGKGTEIITSGQTIKIPVQVSATPKNELASLINEDKTPPSPFKIELGKDSSVYDGKYFISFYATDEDSGINRYEIIENDQPLVRSGNTYILQNQNLSGFVTVKAIDNAGNERIQTLELQSRLPWMNILLLIISVLVIFYVIYFFIFRKKR